MTEKIKVGEIYATKLETVEQFNNVVDSTPDYKWMMWSRLICQETYRPLFVLLRHKPTYAPISELGRVKPNDRYWYATYSEVLMEGKKDIVHRG